MKRSGHEREVRKLMLDQIMVRLKAVRRDVMSLSTNDRDDFSLKVRQSIKSRFGGNWMAQFSDWSASAGSSDEIKANGGSVAKPASKDAHRLLKSAVSKFVSGIHRDLCKKVATGIRINASKEQFRAELSHVFSAAAKNAPSVVDSSISLAYDAGRRSVEQEPKVNTAAAMVNLMDLMDAKVESVIESRKDELKGARGFTGATGKSIKGDTGERGSDGVSVSGFSQDGLNVTVNLSDGSTHSLELPEPPHGDKGDRGLDGPRGIGIMQVHQKTDREAEVVLTNGEKFPLILPEGRIVKEYRIGRTKVKHGRDGKPGNPGKDGKDGKDGQMPDHEARLTRHGVIEAIRFQKPGGGHGPWIKINEVADAPKCIESYEVIGSRIRFKSDGKWGRWISLGGGSSGVKSVKPGANISVGGDPQNPVINARTGGFIDYNDASTATTPVSMSSDTWTNIPNDGLGAFTNKNYKPTGVSELMDNGTGAIDASELSLGDVIYIRNDFTVTPTTNNTAIHFRYQLGTGGGTYYLETRLGRLDEGSGIPYRFSLGVHAIYMGDNNTLQNPIQPQVRCSGNASLVNAGSVIMVQRY